MDNLTGQIILYFTCGVMLGHCFFSAGWDRDKIIAEVQKDCHGITRVK